VEFQHLGLLPGDAGIFQTVLKIKQAVDYSLREPEQRIRKRAEGLTRLLKERDQRKEAAVLGDFVKAHFHFTADPRGLEYVKSPDVIDAEIDRYGTFAGDCDDASGYLAALLKSIGYPVRLTVISSPQNPKGTFTHIYTEVYLHKNGGWVPMDMTAKTKPFGWEAPFTRKETFDV